MTRIVISSAIVCSCEFREDCVVMRGALGERRGAFYYHRHFAFFFF